MKLALILWIALAGWAVADDSCEGDGPGPFAAAHYNFKTKLIDTVDPLAEFVLLEKRNRIIYRTTKYDVFDASIDTGKSETLTRAKVPLSAFANAQENIIALQNYPNLFHLTDGMWLSYQRTEPPLEHLFWNRDVLYSASAFLSNWGVQSFSFYRYLLGQTAADKCVYVTDRPYRVAKGHRYPYFFVYRTEPAEKGTRVRVFAIDVRTCQREWFSRMNEVVHGPVEDVHVFVDQASFGVNVNNPKKNFYWRHPKGCAYYKTEDEPIMVPSHYKPFAATWSKKNGLGYIDLSKATRAQMLMGLPFVRLHPRHLVSASQKDTLYLAPVAEGSGKPSLIELNLK